MGHAFYITVEGVKQGTLKGATSGSPRQVEGAKTKNGKIAGIKFLAEATTARDVATGQASGKRQHKAITITKEWDASSPQLYQALVTNEVLKSVLFEFVKTDAKGEEYIHHTIKLTNAAVANIRAYLDLTDTSGDPYDGHELEDIAFSFQKIEMANVDGKTQAVDG